MTSTGYFNIIKWQKRFLRIVLFVSVFAQYFVSYSQNYSTHFNEQYNNIEKHLYRPAKNFHTSIKQYKLDEINHVVSFDSILYLDIHKPQGHLNIWQRFRYDNLFEWKNEALRVTINPLFNLETGKEQFISSSTRINTRGIMIEGDLGKNFAFYADFYENQGSFPSYIEDFIDKRNVIPGQGKQKKAGSTGQHDFAQSTGYISFNAGPYINLQLGHGKHFIGDGYRSMLLSDVAYSYPYLKFTATAWKIKYQAMIASLTHLEREGGGDTRYPIKYGFFHYLDWNVGNRLSVGLFESVIWAAQDTLGNYRGLDMHYVNPFIFMRPVEYSIGSPDNVTIGINTKYIAARWLTFYGQVVLGEFKADEVFSGKKWWANKQGFQVGFKTFDLFGINNLRWQCEFNQARPYLYSHYQPITNYGHYNQPLAHPFGANFREFVSILNYHYKRLYIRGELVNAMIGKDTPGISYGNDIFLPNEDRPGDYGHFIGQGVKTKLSIIEPSISYLVNPRTNMNIALGARIRTEENDTELKKSTFIWFGFRTSLSNLYYDF